MRTALYLALALAIVPACKKKDDAAAGGAAGGTTAEKATDKPAAGGPVKTDPKALFADFAPDSKTPGMDLLNKDHDGATFSGVIKTAPGDAAPTSAIMDVDGQHIIMMGFTDPPKGIKAGDTVNVTCKIGGESGNMMQVTDCVMAK